MFYSAQILARKGPLGIIWIAAHHDKKYLKRHQIFSTDIRNACDRIISPEAPLALRLSGQLMLGVVRIYFRQVEFLATDADHALVKLRQVDVAKTVADQELPEDNMVAAPDTINLPDSVYEDPFAAGAGLSFDFPLGEAAGTPRALTPRGRRSSVTFIEEEHSQLGSQLFNNYGEPETFEAADFGQPLEPVFVDEPERARAAVSGDAGPANPLAGLPDTPGSGARPDNDGALPDLPDVPDYMAEDPVVTPATGELPASPPRSDRLSTDGPAELPDIELPTGGDTDAGTGTAASKRRRAALTGEAKRRRFQQDVGPDGAPATKLQSSVYSKQLRDRSGLLRDRGGLHAPLQPALDPLHVAMQSGAAAESKLYRPAVGDVLASGLLAPFRSAMGTAPTAMLPPPNRPPRAQADRNADADAGVAATRDGGAPEEAEMPLPDAMDYEFGEAPPTAGADEPFPGHEDAIESGTPAAAPSPARSLRRLSTSSSLQLQASSENPSDEVLHKRALKAENQLEAAVQQGGSVVLAPQQGILRGKSRADAARLFIAALSLQANGAVHASQDAPFGKITIVGGPQLGKARVEEAGAD